MSTVQLIIESHVIQSMIERIISEKHEVLGSANNGPSGLEKFKSLNPNVVLLDVTFCSKEGEDLLSQIKDHNPQARIVLVSRRGAEGLVTQKLLQGAIGVIAREEISISDPERRTALLFKIDHLLRA